MRPFGNRALWFLCKISQNTSAMCKPVSFNRQHAWVKSIWLCALRGYCMSADGQSEKKWKKPKYIFRCSRAALSKGIAPKRWAYKVHYRYLSILDRQPPVRESTIYFDGWQKCLWLLTVTAMVVAFFAFFIALGLPSSLWGSKRNFHYFYLLPSSWCGLCVCLAVVICEWLGLPVRAINCNIVWTKNAVIVSSKSRVQWPLYISIRLEVNGAVSTFRLKMGSEVFKSLSLESLKGEKRQSRVNVAQLSAHLEPNLWKD